MIVTIVPESRLVQIDGEVIKCDFDIDPNIATVQWDSDNPRSCHAVQHKGGSRHIKSLDEFQPALDAFAAKKAEQEEQERIKAQEQADYLASEQYEIDTAQEELAATDKDMARVAEDAIDALQSVLEEISPATNFTERMSAEAQEIIQKRKELRGKIKP